jgi:hypothetical protein
MSSVPEWDEAISDDGALLLDRLVRSLYRNKDGFLCVDERAQKSGVDEQHNAVCLYIYTADENGFYTLSTYYVYGGKEPHSYEEWRAIAFESVDELKDSADIDISVYGWSTTTIRVTPIRTGDLFICVDENGVRGVRITFNTRKAKREA